ncbi:hypothetical protein, partial [Burkholderia gladioli]|uniref:hypothetical protein n=1 Tax=Burkholderia gladioli TaxID=28095 RepID=UPI001ABBA7F2
SFVARLCFSGAVPSGLDQSSADQGCGCITRDRWKAKNRGKLKTVVFNCELKENKKLVSLCSSKDLSNRAGFLQYRYGSPGKIELTYPEIKTGSQLHFGYDAYSRADLSTFILGFENGIYRYELSETTDGGEQEVATRELLVGSPNHRRDMHLTCLDDANLTSNISTLESVVPCDRNHEIVDGGCR